MLAPVIVSFVIVPEFSSEMAEGLELFKGDELSVECFVIALDFATSSRIVRFAEDEFDSEAFRFGFEQFGDELFAIVEIDFTRNASFAKSPLQCVDGCWSVFFQIRFTYHTIA